MSKLVDALAREIAEKIGCYGKPYHAVSVSYPSIPEPGKKVGLALSNSYSWTVDATYLRHFEVEIRVKGKDENDSSRYKKYIVHEFECEFSDGPVKLYVVDIGEDGMKHGLPLCSTYIGIEFGDWGEVGKSGSK